MPNEPKQVDRHAEWRTALVVANLILTLVRLILRIAHDA